MQDLVNFLSWLGLILVSAAGFSLGGGILSRATEWPGSNGTRSVYKYRCWERRLPNISSSCPMGQEFVASTDTIRVFPGGMPCPSQAIESV